MARHANTSGAGAFLEDLGYATNGEREEFSDTGFYFLELPATADGQRWHLLLADGSDYFMELEEQHASSVSAGRETLYFSCSDTVMACELVCFRDQKMLWALRHDSDSDGANIRIEAQPPAFVGEMIGTLGESTDAGPYDLVAAIGERLTGFMHGKEMFVDGQPAFQGAEPIE